MNLHQIKKKLFDTSPRQIYYEAQSKILGRKTKTAWDVFAPVFVLSTGRVGTETLDALFQLAPKFFSHHEPAPTLYRLSKLAYENQENLLARNILREAFLTTRQDLLNYSLQCGKGYIETSPQVTFLAPMILGAIPNARFIHLVRDPRAVIRSGMRRKWYAGHPNDPTRITPLPNSPHFSIWDQYNSFQKNIWLWIETNRWILEIAAQLPPEKILTARSEDVFSMKQETVQDLYTFIGAEVPPSSKISKLLGKKMNAQKTGEFPSWESWLPEQKKTLVDMASEMATRFGYEL